ncbi:hypothetical protein [Rubritalea tangerina]
MILCSPIQASQPPARLNPWNLPLINLIDLTQTEIYQVSVVCNAPVDFR